MSYDVQPAPHQEQNASIEPSQVEPAVGLPLKRPKPAEMLKQLAGHLTTRTKNAASFDAVPSLGDAGLHVGFIDNADGANVRAKPGGEILAKLAPGTRVVLEPAHRDAAGWRYVTAVSFDDASGNATMVRGCVNDALITTNAPEPGAVLYQVAAGDTAQEVVARYYPGLARPGHDLRYFENVLLRVNREQNRKGVQGTNPSDIRLVQGERIWLPSPAYLAKLEPLVDTGSYSGGKFAEAKQVYAEYRERIADVLSSMRVSRSVGREYTEFLVKNQAAIAGIFGSLLLAEAFSWWAIKSKTPIVPMKVVALGLQAVLLGLGVECTRESMVAAEKHGCAWLDISWHADHKSEPLAAASEQFTHMLVQALLVISSLAFTAVKLWTLPKFTPVVAELRAAWSAGAGRTSLGPRPGDIDAVPAGALQVAAEQRIPGIHSGQTPAQARWAPLSGQAAALPPGIPFALGGTGFTPEERAAEGRLEGQIDVLQEVPAVTDVPSALKAFEQAERLAGRLTDDQIARLLMVQSKNPKWARGVSLDGLQDLGGAVRALIDASPHTSLMQRGAFPTFGPARDILGNIFGLDPRSEPKAREGLFRNDIESHGVESVRERIIVWSLLRKMTDIIVDIKLNLKDNPKDEVSSERLSRIRDVWGTDPSQGSKVQSSSPMEGMHVDAVFPASALKPNEFFSFVELGNPNPPILKYAGPGGVLEAIWEVVPSGERHSQSMFLFQQRMVHRVTIPPPNSGPTLPTQPAPTSGSSLDAGATSQPRVIANLDDVRAVIASTWDSIKAREASVVVEGLLGIKIPDSLQKSHSIGLTHLSDLRQSVRDYVDGKSSTIMDAAGNILGQRLVDPSNPGENAVLMIQVMCVPELNNVKSSVDGIARIQIALHLMRLKEILISSTLEQKNRIVDLFPRKAERG